MAMMSDIEMAEQENLRGRETWPARLSSADACRRDEPLNQGNRSVQHGKHVGRGELSGSNNPPSAQSCDLIRNRSGAEAHVLPTLGAELHSKEKCSESAPQEFDVEGQRAFKKPHDHDSVNKRQELRTSEPYADTPNPKILDRDAKYSDVATRFYTISYLILFAILGTLARLGLQALNSYPGAPVQFSVFWANISGTLVFGFLGEDQKIFKSGWTALTNQHESESAASGETEKVNGTSGPQSIQKAHMALKKTIPLYVGLATGFCGSLTSFSSFIRDTMLSISDDLPSTDADPVLRNGGYSFMAAMAVVIVTVTSCLSTVSAGAHLAAASESWMPSLSFTFTRKVLDPLMAFVAWGCWLGALLLAIYPPDRGGGTETWRGKVLFAIVFAPVGCLCRFYASNSLNGKLACFPLGTFMVNIVGTLLLGITWDLQHVPLGGQMSCQVLQGIQDGFCGCLTTVSTWCGELVNMKRAQSYRYGLFTLLISTCILIIVMGSLRWTDGFASPLCIT